MTMPYQDPSFYISVVSSACLFMSEILPFLPIKSNGFIEMIINLLKNKKNNKVQNVDNDALNIDMKNDNKILELIKKQDESIHELSNKLDTLIIVLKK